MKKVIILIILCILTFKANAQVMHQYNTNFTINLNNFVDSIPIEIENDQIYIPIIISGKSYRFNLDTGSSQGLVFYGTQVPIIHELGDIVSHDANNISDTVKVVQLSDFQLGKLKVSGYVASMVKKTKRKIDYDGIIGFDLINKGISVKIDSKNKVLILSDIKDYFKRESGQILKYKLKWFVPYIKISPFIRHIDEALFDTGARQLYQINKDSFLKHNYKSKQVNKQIEGQAEGNFSKATNSTEKTDIVYFLNLERLKWNAFAFNNVRSITTQGASRIGSQIFNYGSIIIIPKNKQIIFQSHNNADSVNVSNKQFGIAFIDKNDKPTIGLIWNKSEAYKLGMRQGDIILKIDNRIIKTYSDFLEYNFEEGRKYKFILRDIRGFNKEITIKR